MSRFRFPILFTVWALLLADAAAVCAQSGSERTAAAREAASFHIGPFYFTPSLSIDNIGFDSNAFLDPETAEPQSDFLFSVTPSLGLAVPVASRALFAIQFNPRGEYYRRLSGARNFSPQGLARAEIFFSRLDLFGEGEYRGGRGRPSYEIEKPKRYGTTLATGGVRYRPRPKLSFELAAYRSGTSFADDESFDGVDLDDALTGYDLGVRLTARRRLTAKTSAEVSVYRSASTFEASPEKEGARLRLMPGVTFAPNALIAGTLHVGMLRFTPESDMVPDFAGVIADVDLSYTFREATRISARWRRDLSYSFEPLQPYYILTGLGVSMRRQIAGRVDGIVTFDQYESSYRNLVAAGLPERTDTTRVYSGDLGMRLNRHSRVGLRVSTTSRRSSQRAARNYRGTQIGLSYSYGK